MIDMKVNADDLKKMMEKNKLVENVDGEDPVDQSSKLLGDIEKELITRFKSYEGFDPALLNDEEDSNDCESGNCQSNCNNGEVCDGVKNIQRDLKNKHQNLSTQAQETITFMNRSFQKIENDRLDVNNEIYKIKQGINTLWGRVQHELDDRLANVQIDNTPRQIEIITPEQTEPNIVDTPVHEKFELVLKYINRKRPVILHGDTGCGKTTLAKDISDAMEWDWYFSNKITEEYQLTGFINANGEYQKTPFFEWFNNGGLFCLDEFDASIPEASIKLNTALSQGEFDFPHGNFTMNEECRFIATANSLTGANNEYTARLKQDKATLDRFVRVEMDYDANLEKQLVNNEVYNLILSLRKYVKTRVNLNISFSTRTAIYFDEYLADGIPLKNLITDILLKEVDIEDFKDFRSFVCENETTGNIPDGLIDDVCNEMFNMMSLEDPTLANSQIA